MNMSPNVISELHIDSTSFDKLCAWAQIQAEHDECRKTITLSDDDYRTISEAIHSRENMVRDLEDGRFYDSGEIVVSMHGTEISVMYDYIAYGGVFEDNHGMDGYGEMIEYINREEIYDVLCISDDEYIDVVFDEKKLKQHFNN